MTAGRDTSELINLLLQHGGDVQALDFKNRTPVHYAFVQKNKRNNTQPYDPLHVLKQLINEKTIGKLDLNQQDINGKTIFHYMAQRSSLNCLQYILDLFHSVPSVTPINLELEDKFMNTFLGTAINFNHQSFAEFVVRKTLLPIKGFIYEEKLPQLRQQNNVFGGGWGIQQ